MNSEGNIVSASELEKKEISSSQQSLHDAVSETPPLMSLSIRAAVEAKSNSTKDKLVANKFAKLGEFESELLRNEREIGVCKYRILTHAIRNGELLSQIKKTLKHGEFSVWIKAVAQPRLGLSHRTINRYLKIYNQRKAILASIRRELTKHNIAPTSEAIEAQLATMTLRHVEELLKTPEHPKETDQASKDNRGEIAIAPVKSLSVPKCMVPRLDENSPATTASVLEPADDLKRPIEYFLIDSAAEPCESINYLVTDAVPASLPTQNFVAFTSISMLNQWIDTALQALDCNELEVGLLIVVGSMTPEMHAALRIFPGVVQTLEKHDRFLLGIMRPNRTGEFYRAFQNCGLCVVPQELVAQLIGAIS